MTKRKVLLLGWDSADWRIISPLLDRGLMPALSALVDRGVMGNLASIEPVLSPLIWNSIATGKRPHKHGVLGFVEPDPRGGGIRPVGSATRQTKALWNMLSEAGLDTHVVGWFASHPAEAIRGVCVSERFPLPVSPNADDWPLPVGAVLPEELCAALAEFRVHPREIDGSQLLPFIPRAAELDQRDPSTVERLTELARILAQTASIQAVATWILENKPWDFLGVYFQALDEFGHGFMPFHPPRLPGISERDSEIYGQVIESAYRFHDMMLARLLHLAGEDATVVLVSDHGFESGAHRPGPVANQLDTMAGWHRPFGIVAMAGPGIAKDQRIYGSSILDVTPTVLHLFDFPVAEDMDGKVLVTALENPAPVKRIPSWEKPAEDSAPAAAPALTNAQEERAVLDQLIALGYMEPLDADTEKRVQSAAAEIAFNRITSLVQSNCHREAEVEARRLVETSPGEPRYRMKLAQVLLCSHKLDDAKKELEAVEAKSGTSVHSAQMSANLFSLQGRLAAALECLSRAEQLAPASAEVQEQIGWILLRQRHWQTAEKRFRRALDLEPDSPQSLVGLARALVRQNQDVEAVEQALAAVSLQHFLPLGHFQLGAILSKIGFYERAIQAFETGLSMQPGNLVAHRYLSRLFYRMGRTDQARVHEGILAEGEARRAGETIP